MELTRAGMVVRVAATHRCPDLERRARRGASGCVPGSPAAGVPLEVNHVYGRNTLGHLDDHGVVEVDLVAKYSRDAWRRAALYLGKQKLVGLDLEQLRLARVRWDAERERKREKAASEHEAMVAHELKTGLCTQERKSELQAWLKRLEDRLAKQAGDVYHLIEHHIEVPTPEGSKHELSFQTGGEVHVLAFNYESGPTRAHVAIRDPDGYAVATGSALARLRMAAGGDFRSRLVETKAGAIYVATLKGRGCSILAVFRPARSSVPTLATDAEGTTTPVPK